MTREIGTRPLSVAIASILAAVSGFGILALVALAAVAGHRRFASGELMPDVVFWREVAPLVGGAGVWLVVTGFGLWRGKWWAPWLAVAYWIVLRLQAATAPVYLLPLGFSWWSIGMLAAATAGYFWLPRASRQFFRA